MSPRIVLHSFAATAIRELADTIAMQHLLLTHHDGSFHNFTGLILLCDITAETSFVGLL
jgi:hypothetical protein